MLDIKKIRQNPDFYKQKLATRGIQAEEIDEVLALDQKRRDLLQQTETMKAQRNAASKKIGEAKRNGESADEAIKETRELGDQIKQLDEQVEANDEELHDKMSRLPNVPHDGVPVSLTEDGAVELRKVGKSVTLTLNPSTTGTLVNSLVSSTLTGRGGFLAPGSSTTLAWGRSWNGPFTTSCSMNT